MPRENDLEIKVGAFVVAAAVCFTAFMLAISDFSLFRQGDIYHVVFQYAGGLKKGAPVRLAGVDTGYVRDIRVDYMSADRNTPGEPLTRVAVDIWMDRGYRVPSDSAMMISQLGLLGEKYLEIIPGAALTLLAPGTTVRGQDPVPVETLMKMVGSIGPKLSSVLDNLNQGVLSEQNKASLASVLANVAAITTDMKEGKGTAGKLMTDPSIFDNLDEMTADLKANPWKLFYRPKQPAPYNRNAGK